jgi:two-component system, LytTR family, sensor kinase
MFVSVVWIAPAIFATVNRLVQSRLQNEPRPSLRDLLWAGGDWLVYAALTPFIFWAADRWPIVRPHVARRATLHLGFALLFCVGWALAGKLLELGLGLLLNREQTLAFIQSAGDQIWVKFGTDLLSWIFTTLPFGVIVYVSIAGMAHAIRYFVEAREGELQMSRLSEQLTGARFAALQAQLNPHFLFNTLNTIAVRARDGDTGGTVRMVEQLSDVLRRTLTRQRAPEVTLDEELELVRQYVAIEQARFSDRLQVFFDVDHSLLAAALPSFALQHLVENAIRHGITKRSGAGSLRIVVRRSGDTLEVTVVDDGAGIDASAPIPPGHGIENTRERLRALYGERGSLIVVPGVNGGTVATLRVPYRELMLGAGLAER